MVDLTDTGGRQPQRRDKLRVVLSFGNDVIDIQSTDASDVAAVTGSGRVFIANSIVAAAGFTTQAIDGIPAGDNGAVLNLRGRVVSRETGQPLERLYVVGWAKRGAVGGVGDNRTCAAETVAQLVADLAGNRM